MDSIYLFSEGFAEEECLKNRVTIASIPEVDQPIVMLIKWVLGPYVPLQLRAGPTHYAPPKHPGNLLLIMLSINHIKYNVFKIDFLKSFINSYLLFLRKIGIRNVVTALENGFNLCRNSSGQTAIHARPGFWLK